ncbi:hypothetical protein [Methylobacterium sp. GC_Met_2]|uniref:hypothetical protein n=1 Tax=Methylobacterium sp. GC_Met_2 TaxID=2937376 RepID=UPI00226B0D02|nr:hypothetical protein [Methylobacterium sp. GC_Met_2]
MAALLLLASCDRDDADSTYEPSSNDTFILLIDKSASFVKKGGAFNHYVSQLLETVTPNSLVIVLSVVDANTRGDPPVLLKTKLPKVPKEKKRDILFYLRGRGDFSKSSSCLKNSEYALRVFRDAKEHLRAEIADSFEKIPPSKKTYLIDAMRDVSDELEDRENGKNVVLILSDGLEDSNILGKTIVFDNLDFWRNTSPKNLIEDIKKSGFRPNFNNADVYIAGLSAKQTQVYDFVRRFWIDFFEYAGARKAVRRIGLKPVYDQEKFDNKAEEFCQGT